MVTFFSCFFLILKIYHLLFFLFFTHFYSTHFLFIYLQFSSIKCIALIFVIIGILLLSNNNNNVNNNNTFGVMGVPISTNALINRPCSLSSKPVDNRCVCYRYHKDNRDNTYYCMLCTCNYYNNNNNN